MHQYRQGILVLLRMTLGLWQVADWTQPTICSVIRQTAYLATAGGVQWLGNKEKVVYPLASGAEAAPGVCLMCLSSKRLFRNYTVQQTNDHYCD